MNITINDKPLDLAYTPPQEEIFQECNRYNVVSKGRRLGATHGAIQFVIEKLLNGTKKILWVDTIHSNIDRYIERYSMPILRKLKPEFYSWRQQKKELSILDNICDFRSADRPENLEGFGYDIIILNEAGIILGGNGNYLWENAIRPMTLDYKASVWFLGTPKGKTNKRTGEEHLYFSLYKRGLDDNYPEWRSLKYSTYDNPLLDPNDINELESETPSAVRRQEIHGDFVELGLESVFQRSWWKFYTETPKGIGVRRIIQSWDTAFKEGQENDYSVCTTWLESVSGYYLLDMWRDRINYPTLVQTVKNLANQYKPNCILIEDKASGQSLLQTLKVETRLPILAIKPDRDKTARATACTPLIESGRVYLPKDEDFTRIFIDELSDFPFSGHDDIVDSTDQALNWMRDTGSFNNSNIVTRRRKIKAKTLTGY